MSAQSGKTWRAAVSAGRMRVLNGDPMFQIGSTLGTLYALDDGNDQTGRFSNYLDVLDTASKTSKQPDRNDN